MEHYFILGLIATAFLLFAFEVTRPDIVAIGVTVVLLLSGVVTIAEGFSGFSNPAVITVIAMFILSAGIVRSGVADYIAQIVLRLGGANPILLTIAIMAIVGTMSAFMNNIGAVAVLLPTMFVIANQTKYPVTKLLIPLSFGSLLGGIVTLIGTPPNLLVSMALEDAGFQGFRLFDFAPAGLAVMITGTLYMAFIGRHLIPAHADDLDLLGRYRLAGYLTELVLPAGSPLVGQSLQTAMISNDLGLAILRVNRKTSWGVESFVPGPDTVLQAEDRLIAEGDLAELVRLNERAPLRIHAARKFTERELHGDDVELAEVVIAPNSRLVGRSIKEIDIRRKYGVLVLALRRREQTIPVNFSDVPLESADVLLIQASPQSIASIARHSDFLVVKSLEHGPRHHDKAPMTLAIMAIAILTAGTGLLHISVAGMLGVVLMAITSCIKIQEMYEAVQWRVIFLIACMMPLGIAMDSDHTGTAAWLAQHIVSWAGAYGPLVILASLFVFTTLITEVMSNAAAAVLLAPIVIAISSGLGLEPYPFMMAVAIGASTTFLTPIGHQANVLVYGAGNYRFTDFPRVGALLNLLTFFVAMVVIPLVWPFTPLPAN